MRPPRARRPVAPPRRARPARGAGLLDCLVGLALGLLVLQALFDALATAERQLRLQLASRQRLEAQELAQHLLRAVFAASRTAAAAPVLRELSAPRGAGLQVGWDARHSPCLGESAKRAPGNAHRLRLWVDGSGTLQCAEDGRIAQPMVDGLGPWQLEWLERRGTADDPRLRLLGSAGVGDWNRVLLLRLRLPATESALSPPAPQRPTPAQEHWLALAPLDASTTP